MSGKLISLAEFEATRHKLANGAQVQQVNIPMSRFQKPADMSDKNIIRALHPMQVQLCQQIAYRARDLSRQMRAERGLKNDETLEANPTIIAIDFAVVWAFREGYDFEDMLRADNLTFIAEFVMVQQNIQRNPPFFSRDVRLRFARNGARVL